MIPFFFSKKRYLILFLVILFISASVYADECEYIRDDEGKYYFFCLPSRHIKEFRKYKRKNTGVSFDTLTSRFCDSLGYFDWRFDNAEDDTSLMISGKRYLIDTVTVSSETAFPSDSVLDTSFPLRYDAGLVKNMAQRSVEYYASAGFPFSLLTVTKKNRSGKDTVGQNPAVSIIFNISEGEKCLFGPPVFRGVKNLKEKVINYDIAFASGDTFDNRKIHESVENLNNRNYIQKADFSKPGFISSAQQQDTGKDYGSFRRITAPFIIEENSGLGVDGVLAYDSDSDRGFYGFLQLDLLNLFGYGASGNVYYRGDNKGEVDFSISVEKPHLFGFPVTGSAGYRMEIVTDDYGYFQGKAEFLAEFAGRWRAGAGFSASEASDIDTGSAWHFYGMDFILRKEAEKYTSGNLGHRISIRTGSGFSDKKNSGLWRWNAEFSSSMHVPLFRKQAFMTRAVIKNISTESSEKLHEVEKFRVGGNRSVRGYPEKYFAFKSCAYLQCEYLYYFHRESSLYLFVDGGAGFEGDISLSSSERIEMMGYGLGVRIPVKIGSASVEWARNYKEKAGFGRIHVRIRNRIASGSEW